MKKILTASVFAYCLLALCLNYAEVSAAGENPKLSSARVEVSPLTQGVGGQITVSTAVQVNGTC